MATQRYISTSFWDDEWVISLSPEEKLTYLYLMTNTLTNIAGVYKITLKRMAYDIDLDKSRIKEILSRFQSDSKAHYFGEYIIIPSWPKHQKWERRTKIHAGIENVLEELEPEVIAYMCEIGYCYDLSRFKGFVSDDGEVKETPKDESIPFDTIFEHLNKVTGSSYRGVEAHKKLIRARFREGYGVDDFKTVIDFKFSEWKDDEGMAKYVRPDTLFSAVHFDSYLQEASKSVAKESSGSAPRGQDALKELLRMREEAVSGQ